MTTTFRLRSLFAVGIALAGLSVARADSFNLSTGLDGSGNVISLGDVADANWMINESPAPAPAKTVSPNNADYFSGWVANDSSSDWIARNPDITANGTGVYSRTFDLTGYNLSTASLSGSWTLDDTGTISLNGRAFYLQ